MRTIFAYFAVCLCVLTVVYLYWLKAQSNVKTLKGDQDPSIMRCDKVEIRNSPVHGRGVFALRDIQENETIEKAPILLDECKNVPLSLLDYFMKTSEEGLCAYGFGYFSFYNDSTAADAVFMVDVDDKSVSIIATKFIPKGKEIFMSYGPNYWKTRSIEKT